MGEIAVASVIAFAIFYLILNVIIFFIGVMLIRWALKINTQVNLLQEISRKLEYINIRQQPVPAQPAPTKPNDYEYMPPKMKKKYP